MIITRPKLKSWTKEPTESSNSPKLSLPLRLPPRRLSLLPLRLPQKKLSLLSRLPMRPQTRRPLPMPLKQPLSMPLPNQLLLPKPLPKLLLMLKMQSKLLP